jgi:hypothetical protein
MSCAWCVGPYLYPGLKGSPFNPIPSPWPSPNLVVECCCEVFNTIGRSVSTYRQSFKNIGPSLKFEHLHQNAHGNQPSLLSDVRSMCVYILHRHCMWLPSHGEVPRRYNHMMIGAYFNRSESSSANLCQSAINLLDTDHQYADIYRRVWAKLAEHGFYPLPNAR